MDVSMAMRDCINVRNFIAARDDEYPPGVGYTGTGTNRADALAVLRKGGEAA